MYTLAEVVNGISKYADIEIISKISGWQKWVVGTGFGVAMSKSTTVFNELKTNQVVKTLNLIDSEDKIDVDTIYQEMLKQAQKGAVTFDMPMIGAMTLTEKDVNALYNYIKEK